MLLIPASAWARQRAEPTLVDHVLTVVSLGLALFATVKFLRWHQRRTGPRSVSGQGLLPADCGAQLDTLLIGTAKASESVGTWTTVNVSSHGNGFHQGSAHTQDFRRTFKTFDFGYSATNTSDRYLRVQLTVAAVSPDGYVSEPRHSWVDIAPGGRQRAWFSLNMRDPVAFASLQLLEIGVGLTPNHPQQGATFHALAAPRQTLYRLFGVDKSPLSKDFPFGFLKQCAVFVLFALGTLLVMGALLALVRG